MAPTNEPPPSPPSDHGDRDAGESLRPDEPSAEASVPVPTPIPAKKKRVMSEKQLENLRKGREARAEKMKAKKAPAPKAPEIEEEVEEDTRSASMASEPLEEEVPEIPSPKPKRKLSEKQLDALRRARESKASKAVPKKKPPTMTVKRAPTTVFEDLAVF